MQRFSRNSDCVSPGYASWSSRPLAAPRWRSSSSARSCRRARGGITLGRRFFAAATRAHGVRALSVVVGAYLPLWGRSPSRGARGAPACGAALALLALAWPCHRAHGGVALGRRSSAATCRSLDAVRRAQLLDLSACGRRRGRFFSGGGRRHAALTAPLHAAPRWRSWRRLNRAAAFAAA